MDGNQSHTRRKKVVILTIIILVGILFALVVNLLRLQQLSSRSRAAESKTLVVPTSAVSMLVTACGEANVNCVKLKPDVRNTNTSAIIPMDKPGDVTNMECVLSTDRKDAICAYKAKKTQPQCQSGAAFVPVGVGSTTPRCMGVRRDATTNMCKVIELVMSNGQVPLTDVECQKLLITPTVAPKTLFQ